MKGVANNTVLKFFFLYIELPKSSKAFFIFVVTLKIVLNLSKAKVTDDPYFSEAKPIKLPVFYKFSSFCTLFQTNMFFWKKSFLMRHAHIKTFAELARFCFLEWQSRHASLEGLGFHQNYQEPIWENWHVAYGWAS